MRAIRSRSRTCPTASSGQATWIRGGRRERGDVPMQAVMERNEPDILARRKRFLAFQERLNRELLQHRVIRANPYTAWFRRGEQNEAQVRAFIVQFSVFSNQFLIAQLNKMINADSLETMRAT